MVCKTPYQKGRVHLFEDNLAQPFSFSTFVTNTVFAFLWHMGKMNTGRKHFDLARGNAVAGT